MRRILLTLGLSLAYTLNAACAAEIGASDDGEPPDETAFAVADDALTGSSPPFARNVHDIALIVDANRVARVSYTDTAGVRHHALAWGAINARTPSRDRAQVAFHRDYSGGSGSAWGAGYWRQMRNVCGRYTGPSLPLAVGACTAPDGSHWALQVWRRLLPNGGYAPRAGQSPYELWLSHWSGALPDFRVQMAWTRWPEHNSRMFLQLAYAGKGVYGFDSTSFGVPLDTYGRNVYVDVHDPPWGAGWFRFNSGLTHNPLGRTLDDGTPAIGGNMCMGMLALYGRTRPPEGDRYRATVRGPGVMPILRALVDAPGPYDAARQAELKAVERTFVPPGDSCYP